MEVLLIQYQWLAFWVVIGLLTYYYLKCRHTFSYWRYRCIQNPPAIPIFGNTLTFQLPGKSRPEIEMEWYQKFGRCFGVYHMERPALTIAEPELLKEILVKNFHLFRNRGSDPGKHEIISKNLLVAEYTDWKRIRAIASPTFSSGKLKNMYSLINKCCTDFIEDLEEKVEKQKQFDLKQLMGTFTMDVIARCAFASKINTYKDPNNEFIIRATGIFTRAWWRTMLLMVLPSFISSNQKIQSVVNQRENSLFFINFATKMMRHRRDNNQKHNDFLQLLMDAERNEDQKTDEIDANESHHINEGADELKAIEEALKNVKEKKLTENEVLAQCFLFFIAGFETTATTLSFCTYELALHSEMQERLFKETKDAFDENGEIKYEVLSKLAFLDAVISETLRKYPPFLRITRQAAEDVSLGNSRVKVEKGIFIEIPVYAIHHDSQNFPNPHAFKPDRFLPENRDKIIPYTYLPFGGGPRNCIGMRFALLESKLILAKLIQKFKFFQVSETDVPIIFTKRALLGSKRTFAGIQKR